ncbi:hypothetical protein SAMN04515668_4916 [Hymenobacter arizonensis]|uniref:Uncharacterized protein n=1 Tax=Hymenobacter arizonensis TaxID=1227077 RepID=A0A1I6BQF6_HYMAR|nr:hypothetical protein SAMN04515668_4916 [Hymenobacter arizonensis]
MLQAIGTMHGVVCLVFTVVKSVIPSGPVSHLLAGCIDAFQYRVGLGLIGSD